MGSWCPAHCRAGLSTHPSPPCSPLQPLRQGRPALSSEQRQQGLHSEQEVLHLQPEPARHAVPAGTGFLCKCGAGQGCSGEVAHGGVYAGTCPGHIPEGGTAWVWGGQLLSSHLATASWYRCLLLLHSQLLFSLPKSPGRAADKHGWSLLDIFRETLFEKLSQSCSCSDVSSAELGRWPQQGRVSARAGAGQ